MPSPRPLSPEALADWEGLLDLQAATGVVPLWGPLWGPLWRTPLLCASCSVQGLFCCTLRPSGLLVLRAAAALPHALAPPAHCPQFYILLGTEAEETVPGAAHAPFYTSRLSSPALYSLSDTLGRTHAAVQRPRADLGAFPDSLAAYVRTLQKANYDLRTLMQATHVASLFLSRSLRLEWFTPSVREHFGLQASDTGRPLSALTEQLQYEGLEADAEAVLERLAPIEREVQSTHNAWYLVRLRPYRSLEDTVEGIVVTFVDITDRKQAELAVRRDRSFIEKLLDTVGALIVVLDADYRIVRFNQKCESVTGYSAAEVMGESIFERLIPPGEEAELRSLLTALQNGVDPPPHEAALVIRSGERRRIRWSNTLLRTQEETGKHIIKTGVDVSERRRLEREMTAISDRERQRIGQDLHDILASHLSGTAMMVQGLAQRVAEGDDVSAEEIREISTLVQDASEQARSLSHSLMPLDIRGTSLLEGLENLARRRENMTAVTCTVDGPDAPPSLAPDVTSHLYRIASEALINAIQHGKADRIHIRLDVTPGTLELRVRDNGVGLPDEAPDEAALGLKMMQYRTDLIGGSLRVDSVDDETGGTLVRCTVPLAKATQPPTPQA